MTGMRLSRHFHRSLRRGLGGLVTLFAAVLVVGASPLAAARQELPPPALEGADASIRELVGELRGRVESLEAAGGASPKALGAAYGELGRAAFFFHSRELARASFERAAELAAQEYRWWYYLGALEQEDRALDAAAEALTRAAQLAPKDVPSRLRLAQVRLLQGKLDAAETLFNEIAARDAGDGAEYYGLGRIAAERGDHARAVEYFRRTLELQPAAAEVHQQLGLSYRALGDLEAARRHLTQQAKGELQFADPLITGMAQQFQTSSVYRGMMAERSGRFAEAVTEYRKAVDASPDNVTYRRALAGALGLAGRRDESIAEYRDAVNLAPSEALTRARLAKALVSRDGITDEALAEFQSAVDLAPGLAEARIGLAGALAGRGLWAQAAGHLSEVLKQSPDDLKVRLRRAQMRIALGHGDLALEDLEPVLAATPEDLEARLARAQAWALVGQADRAEKELEGVVADEVNVTRQAIAWMELGAISASRGDLEAAAERYRQATDLAPEHLPAQIALARVNARLGHPDEALAGLELALIIDPDRGEARQLRAQILAEQGRLDEAVSELEALLAADPENFQATLDLASLEARGGQLASAVDRLRSLLDRAPDAATRAIVGFQAGVLEQQRGRVGEAIQLYEQALQAEPAMRDALFNLGLALARQGNLVEARKRFEALLELAPADAEGALALARTQTAGSDFAGARATLERARQRSPSHPGLMRTLVEILLGSPDPAARDPRAALPLARQLANGRPSVENLALFAAALAATGDFAAAAAVQERAVEAAASGEVSAEQRRLLEQDLNRYRQGPPAPAGR
jgi:tetratricopeptide (TPR) repeat protein